MTSFESRLDGMFDEGYARGRGVFFVQGLWRSGTSWVGRMLESHPDLYVCPHELHSYMRMVQVSQFGQPIEQNGFLSERHEAARKTAFLAMLLHLSRTEKPAARLIGERSPGADVALLKKHFPESKLVIVLRDGRDICVSAAFLASKTGADPACIDPRSGQPPLRHVLESALSYSVYVPEYLSIKRAHPGDVLLVKYEDLLVDLESEMMRVFSFLETDIDRAQVAAICRQHAFVSRAGEASGRDDERFWMRKGASGDWKNHLSASAVAEYEHLAGPALEQAGYQRAHPPRTAHSVQANWSALHTARRLIRDIDAGPPSHRWIGRLFLKGSALAALRRIENVTFGWRANLVKTREEIAAALRARFGSPR